MSLPDTTVKVFESTMQGAPTVSGTVGALISLLDGCLVTGFGQVSVTALSVTDNVATLTTNTGHGMELIGNVGPVMLIDGAEPAALNGQWRVATVVNSTTLTFATENIADCIATGTMTMKRAPAGWEKRYSGTNKAVYARTAFTASPALVWVQANGTPTAYSAVIALYETMTDVDTGTNSTASTVRYIHYSNGANSTAREWRVVADAHLAYVFIKNDGSNWYGCATFGDLLSYKMGDGYPCVLQAQESTTFTATTFRQLLLNSLMLRNYLGVPSVVDVDGFSHAKNTYFSNAPQSYPSPVDGGFHAWPVEMWESVANAARGMMPGIYNPLHATTSIPARTIITDIPQLSGRTLLCQPTLQSNSYCCALDITGPWR